MKLDNTMLKSCITRTLKAEFKNCKIYKSKEASPKLPAFFVRYVTVNQVPTGLDFYEQSYFVEVRYRVDDMPANELDTHLELIGGQVVDLLSFIEDTTNGFSCRARSTDYEISDGVLIVMANYVIKRKRVTEKLGPYMESLQEHEEVL